MDGKSNKGLTINQLISPAGGIVGVEILIDEKQYFVSTNQKVFPGIRAGNHPGRLNENDDLVEFERKEIYEIPLRAVNRKIDKQKGKKDPV